MVHRPSPEAYRHSLMWHDHKRQAALLHVLLDGVFSSPKLGIGEPSLTATSHTSIAEIVSRQEGVLLDNLVLSTELIM